MKDTIEFPFVNNHGVMLELLKVDTRVTYFRYASFNFRGDIVNSKAVASVPNGQIHNRDKIKLSESGKRKGQYYYDDSGGMFTRQYLDPIFEPFIK